MTRPIDATNNEENTKDRLDEVRLTNSPNFDRIGLIVEESHRQKLVDDMNPKSFRFSSKYIEKNSQLSTVLTIESEEKPFENVKNFDEHIHLVEHWNKVSKVDVMSNEHNLDVEQRLTNTPVCLVSSCKEEPKQDNIDLSFNAKKYERYEPIASVESNNYWQSIEIQRDSLFSKDFDHWMDEYNWYTKQD